MASRVDKSKFPEDIFDLFCDFARLKGSKANLTECRQQAILDVVHQNDSAAPFSSELDLSPEKVAQLRAQVMPAHEHSRGRSANDPRLHDVKLMCVESYRGRYAQFWLGYCGIHNLADHIGGGCGHAAGWHRDSNVAIVLAADACDIDWRPVQIDE